MERRKPLARMSARRRAALAAAGNPNPWSTIVNTAGRGITPRLAAPTPKKRRHTGPTPQTLAAVKTRSGNRCEFPYPCPAQPAHTHHRRPRRMGGSSDPATNLPSNLLRLCPHHHEWVESHRAEAHRMGLLLHAGDDPAAVPVLHAVHGWVLLAPDGSYTTYSPNHTPNRQEAVA